LLKKKKITPILTERKGMSISSTSAQRGKEKEKKWEKHQMLHNFFVYGETCINYQYIF